MRVSTLRVNRDPGTCGKRLPGLFCIVYYHSLLLFVWFLATLVNYY